ncbi:MULTISPECIES: L-serine ammonia-lyase, iron-sulfur-dependent, subunit alpha [Shouchella]|uniref:L-serine dehydratase n=3 Tax=Bacillaceae TaxID=186817 RepID=A0A060LXE4_9BACI|nr:MULTISPECIES: L-serine ammonia-lyase, iron-sulfur-dependent, subunit alpha [Bacillaceae]RQW20713.1 L-serine ammonia-lyase, iron-sulfur-dependent, subunit alpha [Bacillus sp. C1-1]AIC94872.1 L-serine dehydratase, alpha chain [Shouchella lehensis G1]KQL58200.1 serine dehydratase [Alkalicoccobacillus plakortidis]MBG9784276.1 serine dehydratase [Shouchella lehensis]TES50735.1 L-serine ammonia-lyase, iron-sulfur-dependent, subunit alpha [Shouchella lehensis]
MFRNVSELLALTEEKQCSISEVMIQQEMNVTGKSREEILNKMRINLATMEAAVKRGIEEDVVSVSGLTGGDGKKLAAYIRKGNMIGGETTLLAVANAMATNEVNAAMGTICATPTAGSAGVVPGVLFGVEGKFNPTEDEKLAFLFTSGALGFVVANNASISGAAGGCQAEVGSATGMAAAALVELAGGTPKQSAHGMAIALKNMLGLVCDPVAGLVEVPCVKRNAAGASLAITAADMALAGIESRIPCDEVIEAMYRIGQTMPESLRETGEGGLAATPTGRRLEAAVFGKTAERAK